MDEKLKNIKAIIFDMDGVIVDSEPIHHRARIMTCEKYGIKCPIYDPDEVKFRGMPVVEIFRQIINQNDKPSLIASELADYKTKIYLEIASKEVELIPGALEFIKKAQEKNKKLGLTTSSRKINQDMIFDKFDLHKHFDVIVTGDEIENGKPHPEPFLKTVSKIGIPAENCIVIEDAVNGIVAAKKAGCITCGITTYFKEEKLREAGADYVIDTFDELEKILSL